MKKFLAITTLLVCAVVVCSCTPDGESLKKKYENNGYTVLYQEYGEDGDIEYELFANKDWLEVTVTCYKNGDDAKKRYDEIKAQYDELNEIADELNNPKKFKARKLGNTVIYGHEEAVDIA